MKPIVAGLMAAALLSACDEGDEGDSCLYAVCTAELVYAVTVTVYGAGSATPPDASLTVLVAPDLPPGSGPRIEDCFPVGGAYSFCALGASAGEYVFDVTAPGHQPGNVRVVVPEARVRTCCGPPYEPQAVEITLVTQ